MTLFNHLKIDFCMVFLWEPSQIMESSSFQKLWLICSLMKDIERCIRCILDHHEHGTQVFLNGLFCSHHQHECMRIMSGSLHVVWMIKHNQGFCPPQLSELPCAMLSEDECFRWNVVFIMNDPHISELRQIIIYRN